MITQLYIEINVICIFILALILYKLHKTVNTRSIDKRLFALVLVCAMALYTIDIVWALIDGHALRVSQPCSAFISALYLTQAGVTSYAWFVLVEHRLDTNNPKPQTAFCLCAAAYRALYTLPHLHADAMAVFHR